MKPVKMYTTLVCPYCQMAKRLLTQKGVAEIEEIRVDLDPEIRQAMMALTGRRTVPQIFIGDTHVGGFDDLSALNQAGKLDPLLAD
ncbi:glutaredoxin 3 [Crenobacter luteus]|uniref:Glutaredoxin n=1 Tax=Crenobacter luteus TaxID=1452487 RepID=A0A163C4W9_9NEIS|nr:glutaredoxin 3 [Crenobacter luteus]KZE30065.1 glutaredoxin [Crenobacter luteus]TCP11037.1 glutaredoxin 3 [Crenobacter luteus]